eukprot:CAMPEP_0184209468 /NCGR_PEP_ID=MMETSP0976-20121227/12123_1 /TAXON_ID=483370 /ORGANISM="non described non described, Strain CCMP2097" /LENGTH=200 /DNA_ID=CAMNT_0026514129 /DNA_START=63 /DNA_END=661 /DNA_ORIENTATION=+
MSEGDPAGTLAFIRNRSADKPLNPHAAFTMGGRRLGGRRDGDAPRKDGHSRATGVEIADDAPSSDSEDATLSTQYHREMEESRLDGASTSASERRHANNNKRRRQSDASGSGRWDESGGARVDDDDDDVGQSKADRSKDLDGWLLRENKKPAAPAVSWMAAARGFVQKTVYGASRRGALHSPEVAPLPRGRGARQVEAAA